MATDPKEGPKASSANQTAAQSAKPATGDAMVTNPIYTRLAGDRRKQGASQLRLLIIAVIIAVIGGIGLYYFTGAHGPAKPAPVAATGG